MKVEENKSLKSLNTFGIDVTASHYLKLSSKSQLAKIQSIPSYEEDKRLVLGGGSNILFTGDFEGLVIHNCLPGIQEVKSQADDVWVRCGAGVEWHDLVMFCVQKGYGGIENLSLIPGKCGAAPMQNIGAYGVELKDVFEELEAWDISNQKLRTFNAEDCRFGYRESVFKHELKGRFIILSITLKLSMNPKLNTSYGAIQDTLKEMGKKPSIKSISDAVIAIRKSKLPDPSDLGNAGSFFKNLEMPVEQFQELQTEYPDVPFYDLPNQMVKVPTAWLIEKCGWKGKQIGKVGSHKKQALVLVNYGGAEGKDVRALAEAIQDSVRETFGLIISPEVNIV